MRSIVSTNLRGIVQSKKKHVIIEELGCYSNEIEVDSVAIVKCYDYSCVDVDVDLS